MIFWLKIITAHLFFCLFLDWKGLNNKHSLSYKFTLKKCRVISTYKIENHNCQLSWKYLVLTFCSVFIIFPLIVHAKSAGGLEPLVVHVNLILSPARIEDGAVIITLSGNTENRNKVSSVIVKVFFSMWCDLVLYNEIHSYDVV